MDLSEAIALLNGNGAPGFRSPCRWVDLGCGTGTFTEALAHLLPPGSHIEAVDKDSRALGRIPEQSGGVGILKTVADFTRMDLSLLAPLDGILMANSLHYVADQRGFIGMLLALLQPDGRLIIVEYDSNHPNAWVPHPVSFDRLSAMVSSADRQAYAVKLAEKPSIYGPYNIYSALISLGNASDLRLNLL